MNLALVSLLVLGGAHDGLAQRFEAANQAMHHGHWEQAAASYRALADAGVSDGHLFFNLGNAYLHTGKLGYAIAAYRRSMELLPRHQDVAANLAYARNQRHDALTAPSASPGLKALFFWHYLLSQRETWVLFAVANAWVWLALALRRILPQVAPWRGTAAAAAMVAVLLGGSLLARHFAPNRIAVVVSKEAQAHAGTSDKTLVRFVLHEGAEVRLLEERQGWLRVALPDGQEGWLAAANAEAV